MVVATGIGIVGLGVMGLRMAAEFARHPATEVRAAWDPSPQARAAAAAGLPLVASAEAVVAAPGVDLLYVASPPDSHLGHVGLALDRGLAVLCEKPLSRDEAGSRALAQRVARDAARVGVNFPQASSPALAAMAAASAAGELGAPLRARVELVFDAWPERWQATATWLGRREQGGFVREVVSHTAFVARRLLGPLDIVAATVDRPADGVSAETAADIVLRASGVEVTVRGRVDPAAETSMTWTLEGPLGALRIRDWYSLDRDDGDGWRPVRLGDGPDRDGAYRAQLAAVAELAAGRATTVATVAEALDVQLCIEEVLRRAG